MLLNEATAVSLAVFPKDRSKTRDTRCVLGVLNKTRTVNGQELLKNWLRSPLVDLDAIREYSSTCVDMTS